MTTLFLDAETKDEYMSELGAGWAYALHTKAKEFKVLGMACHELMDGKDGFSGYVTNVEGIAGLVKRADTLVMHNAQYDLGCLKVLGIPVEGKKIFDTMIMGKLYNNSLTSYSLDNLSKMYLGKQKSNDLLATTVMGLQAYQESAVKAKAKPATALTWAKSNMDKIPVEVVAEYAMMDIECTKGLYEFYKDKIDVPELAEKYSYVQKICVDMRARGVRIDLQKAEAAARALNVRIVAVCDKLFNAAGQNLNLNSPRELAAFLEREGIECPRTDKGALSVTKDFLETQDAEICDWIIEAKKLTKSKNDFITKILAVAELTRSEDGKYGRVFPELNLMEAVTGRFSSSNPNIQQIPSRDPEMSNLCRGIFIAEEGERLFAIDFKGQEVRMRIHYEYGQQCEGSSLIKLEFDKNPLFDIYDKVSRMMGVDRPTAKEIDLGLSYGMGGAKLCKTLGLPTEIAYVDKNGKWYNNPPKDVRAEPVRVAGKQGKAFIKRYHEAYPSLKELSLKCQEAMKKNKYIRTLGGRKSYTDGKIYKALNKLIQGSAADQTIEAMLQAEKAGIKMLFPVHDEIVISGTREDAIKLKDIMENAVKLHVPVVAEVNLEGGDSWATA